MDTCEPYDRSGDEAPEPTPRYECKMCHGTKRIQVSEEGDYEECTECE